MEINNNKYLGVPIISLFAPALLVVLLVQPFIRLFDIYLSISIISNHEAAYEYHDPDMDRRLLGIRSSTGNMAKFDRRAGGCNVSEHRL